MLSPVKVALSFLLLGFITFGMMLWQHVGMHIEYPLYTGGIENLTVMTDQINGGVSTGQLSSSEGEVSLKCHIVRNGYTHPFCSMTINIAQRDHGIDATKFDTIRLDVDYISASNDTLLIYFLNKEYQPSERERANMQPLNRVEGKSIYTLPVDSFFVPSWWMYQYPDDRLQGRKNLLNVTGLRLSSGDNTSSRDASITLRSAVLSGKAISKETLYFALIIIWVSTVAFYSIWVVTRVVRASKYQREQNRNLARENEKLALDKQRLKAAVKTDALTGALNRNGLEDTVLSLRLNDPANAEMHSVIYLDVDHFKSINDQYGHATGDQVLVELAAKLNGSTRHSDVVVRMGGEEFLVICSHTVLGDARLLAEKFRADIESMLIAGLSLTCSFGVAECKSHDIESAINEADEYLYKAKQQGRNCICSRMTGRESGRSPNS